MLYDFFMLHEKEKQEVWPFQRDMFNTLGNA
jgi:hypothetical protein